MRWYFRLWKQSFDDDLLVSFASRIALLCIHATAIVVALAVLAFGARYVP